MRTEFLNTIILGNTVLAYLSAAVIFAGGIIVLALIKRVVISRLKKWADKAAVTVYGFIVRMIQRNLVPALYFGAFYAGTQSLQLHPALRKGIDALGVAVLTITAIRFLVALSNYILTAVWLRGGANEARERSLKGVTLVIKIFVWSGGVIFLLDNLGFKVSTVIAGLGIGGVAVALAAQAILGDLFSFFAIMFDRPFEVGDFIIVDDCLGVVEHIGIKTTRIRSLSGEQLVFHNTDLTNSRVRNYKRMERRRVLFRLNVTYQTTYGQLKEIPGIIKNIITNVKDTVFDRAHFFAYGDFNLVIEVVYYVIGADYNKYMDIQQEINLGIKQEFEKRNIVFAYPTQTLYVNKTESKT